tara:strand:- start:155 stop:1039 length:885 start_codon:yes stop_codon:yes gene_type:complete
VLAAMSAALLVSGCSIENVMFVEEPDTAPSTEGITPIAKVRGQSSSKWSTEPPNELDDVLVEEARRDALSQVPHGHVIIHPVVDMETTQTPMGLATLYSTKVFIEGTANRTDDPKADLQTASDHQADEHAAEDRMMQERQSAADAETAEPMTDTARADDDETRMSEDAMHSDGDDQITRRGMEMAKDMEAAAEKAAEARDRMVKDDRAENTENSEDSMSERMMAEVREDRTTRTGPRFGSVEYAEACGIQVDMPDSYGKVCVRPSKSVPIQIMSAAQYLQLLKNRCPAIVGDGS